MKSRGLVVVVTKHRVNLSRLEREGTKSMTIEGSHRYLVGQMRLARLQFSSQLLISDEGLITKANQSSQGRILGWCGGWRLRGLTTAFLQLLVNPVFSRWTVLPDYRQRLSWDLLSSGLRGSMTQLPGFWCGSLSTRMSG